MPDKKRKQLEAVLVLIGGFILIALVGMWMLLEQIDLHGFAINMNLIGFLIPTVILPLLFAWGIYKMKKYSLFGSLLYLSIVTVVIVLMSGDWYVVALNPVPYVLAIAIYVTYKHRKIFS